MSIGDTPRNLADFVGSNSRRISRGERSVEKVRGDEMDEVDVLRREIEEVSNEQTSVNHLRVNKLELSHIEKESSKTDSIVSHTVTNEKLTQE